MSQDKTYTVQGHGEFPLDMLRYDGSVYATLEDKATAEDQHRKGKRQVRLAMLPSGLSRPCAARWESFLWKVVEPESAHLERTGKSVTNDAVPVISYHRDDEGPKASEAYATILACARKEDTGALGNLAAHGARIILGPGRITATRADWDSVRLYPIATPPEAATAEAAGKAPASVPGNCTGCYGRGEVGGLLPGDGGYDSVPCPCCDGTGREPAGVPGEREFSEWLNERRMKDVSEVFHDIVGRYAAALAAQPRSTT